MILTSNRTHRGSENSWSSESRWMACVQHVAASAQGSLLSFVTLSSQKTTTRPHLFIAWPFVKKQQFQQHPAGSNTRRHHSSNCEREKLLCTMFSLQVEAVWSCVTNSARYCCGWWYFHHWSSKALILIISSTTTQMKGNVGFTSMPKCTFMHCRAEDQLAPMKSNPSVLYRKA